MCTKENHLENLVSSVKDNKEILPFSFVKSFY